MATVTSSGQLQSASWLTIPRLRWTNAFLALLHAANGVAILLLSNDKTYPIRTYFLNYNEQTERLETQPDTIFDLRLAPLIASFVFISAIAHTLVILPGVYEWYARNLRRGINYVRWWEYAASASLMIVVIAILPGMYDVGSLVLIFFLNATMLLFGLLMEMYERPEARRVNWTPFYFGSIAGSIPWAVIALYLWAPGANGDPPAFVYGIFFSLFAWYTLFAVNMWLQYRRIGPWRDYLVGEFGYMVLSFTAKSALAWQVFFGALNTPT